MTTPSLRHFETFIAIVETGSFTQAARQLVISKAAVSYSIRLLEESLSVTLLIRSTRRVMLSDEGELLYAQCQRLKDELDTTRQLLSTLDQAPSGTLRISANPILAEKSLQPLLKQYLQQYPQMHIELFLEERMPDMKAENIDLVFGINWSAPEDIVAKKLGKTRHVICASPNYLAKHGTPQQLSDLKHHHFIAHSGRGPVAKLVQLKQGHETTLASQLRINDATMIKQCALDDMGIIQLHEYMVADELASTLLVEVLADYQQTQIPLFVYYQKHRFVQPKIKAFVNLL